MGKKYVCKKKCFFRTRLWEPGDSFPATPRDKDIPTVRDMFKLVQSAETEVEIDPDLEDEDPKTLFEMNRREEAKDDAREALLREKIALLEKRLEDKAVQRVVKQVVPRKPGRPKGHRRSEVFGKTPSKT